MKKVRKRRFNILKFLTIMLFLYLVVMVVVCIIKIPIKNIIVINNNYYSDESIIETAKIHNYPSFFQTFSYKIEKRIKKLPLVKEVSVTKKWGFIVEIDIKEYKILYKEKSSNKYMLENNNEIEINETVYGVATLINFVPDEIKNKMIEKMGTVKIDVLNKISEIEYSPTEYDQERFLLYMCDGNEVYITLNKIKEFGKYIDIKKQLNGKKGILYLDSGNYLEIKE